MNQNLVNVAGEEQGEEVRNAGSDVISAQVLNESVAEWGSAGLLLTSDGLARLLRVSKRTLGRLRSSGKLPRPVQFGRLVRWRTAEVREWVEAGCPALAIWEPPAAGTRAARVFCYRRAR